MVLPLRNKPEWKTLELMPVFQKLNSTYAKIFVANRLNEKKVLLLTAENLNKMDITILADQFTILHQIETLALKSCSRKYIIQFSSIHISSGINQGAFHCL